MSSLSLPDAQFAGPNDDSEDQNRQTLNTPSPEFMLPSSPFPSAAPMSIQLAMLRKMHELSLQMLQDSTLLEDRSAKLESEIPEILQGLAEMHRENTELKQRYAASLTLNCKLLKMNAELQAMAEDMKKRLAALEGN
ncbi:uncharacterized protein PAC_15156 [Phialocephala subalpina]|uniref:Uncharacterized protein n=1 Tax=Phialocephala subalpina TaxID=576137 RepID=A0A1L7XJZ8_9HELO|nr:uncharacterized protein PAC_15156 [Phialocephala subalpina]